MFFSKWLIFACFYLLTLYKYSISINQLSFSGGGSFGAIEIGILKRVLENDPDKKYQLYTGISAGGLNAGYLCHFSDLTIGVLEIEKMYANLRTHEVYELFPTTSNSVFNSKPLEVTLTKIMESLPNDTSVAALIGTTNLHTGILDIYDMTELSKSDRVSIMMATSAIPVLFPPVVFREHYYADGGILSNELLNIVDFGEYLNITYITPFESQRVYSGELKSIKDMVVRTYQIVRDNFDNPLASLNQHCEHPVGEINVYFVDSKHVEKYSLLDFNHGRELIDVGYLYAETRKYKIC